MKYMIIIFICTTLTGCNSSKKQLSENEEKRGKGVSPIIKTRLATESEVETFKAMDQAAQADFVIGFRTWDEITIQKPAQTETIPELEGRFLKNFTKEEMNEFLGANNLKKILAVVVMDPRVQENPVKMENIEAFLKKFKFKTIIFHGGGASRRPILRENGINRKSK